MGAPEGQKILPPNSVLQTLLDSPGISQDPERHLSVQIAHNLRFQHGWTDVRIHETKSFHRPLISGLPPQRLYVHPDEQIELLQKQKSEGKTGMPDLPSEREWVLPSHLREQWSLRRFGEVFDAISTIPERKDGDLLFAPPKIQSMNADDALDTQRSDETSSDGITIEETNEWRTSQPKRILLATLDDDSTIVYYIIHDGIVKPRQN